MAGGVSPLRSRCGYRAAPTEKRRARAPAENLARRLLHRWYAVDVTVLDKMPAAVNGFVAGVASGLWKESL